MSSSDIGTGGADSIRGGSVAVIGAGTMGHGIAQLFGVAGFDVALYDNDPRTLASAMARIERNLSTLISHGLVTREQAEMGMSRIRIASDLPDAVRAADLIVEAVIEKLEVKHTLLQEIEEHAPSAAIIASNTSSFRVADMAGVLARPERFLVTHYWNPPHIMPLVEVVRGEKTADETIARTEAFLETAGKIPARVQKDVPGFVGNRMQHALRREAIAIVAEGIASPEVVDQVARLSFGLRFPISGPLETVDLGGLDLTIAIQNYLLPTLDRSTSPSSLVREKVAHGELGAKSGRGFYEWPEGRWEQTIRERDQALLEMIRWLSERDPRLAGKQEAGTDPRAMEEQ